MQSPLLETFHSRHPGLRVELIMSDHFLDIAKGEADVAIRAGVPNEETLVGRKIADVPWALYCSRAYLARHGRVERAEDIAGHSVIEFDGDIRDHHAAKWLRSVAPTARVVARSNTVPGLLMTVKSGAGLAPLPVPLAVRETRPCVRAGPVARTLFANIPADPPRPPAYAARPHILRFHHCGDRQRAPCADGRQLDASGQPISARPAGNRCPPPNGTPGYPGSRPECCNNPRVW